MQIHGKISPLDIFIDCVNNLSIQIKFYCDSAKSIEQILKNQEDALGVNLWRVQSLYSVEN